MTTTVTRQPVKGEHWVWEGAHEPVTIETDPDPEGEVAVRTRSGHLFLAPLGELSPVPRPLVQVLLEAADGWPCLSTPVGGTVSLAGLAAAVAAEYPNAGLVVEG